ncbi:DUF2249 domain-containing protein [Knoellia sp. p5-6-4]|uniref:DUF2249 domain-containing protein n=1 Tax=unclassified Knoellia TaxID=2618719 RepID=UPI0031F37E06
MDTVVIASTEQDAAAVEAVKGHHAEMAGTLSMLARRIAAAIDTGSSLAARDELVGWAEGDLVPHALAEEKAMYPLAHEDSRARLLIDAMLAEHALIMDLVARLRGATTQVEAAAWARALSVTFESHLAKENDQVLPLLAQSPGVSLAGALTGMHELLGDHGEGHDHSGDRAAAEPEVGGCGGGCACGESDGPDLPELDARAVPHAIRHATIFGALDALGPGAGMVLIAPHDPLPLLRQVEEREPGAFTVDYLARGPETWRLRFVRA